MYSLKGRIVLIFSMIIIFCFFYMMIVRQAIESFIDSRVEKVYTDMAGSVLGSCESVMDNMELLSQQLGFGVIDSGLINSIYGGQLSAYEKILYEEQLRETIRVLTFTNADVGLVTYDDGQQVLYGNFYVPDIGPLLSPSVKLYQKGEISYFEPQKSASPVNGEDVLMLRRRIHIKGESPVYLSVETNFRTLTRVLSVENPLLFLDESGSMIYSEIPEIVPVSANLKNMSGQKNADLNGYQMFAAKSERGFSLGLLIDIREISKARFSSYALLMAAMATFTLVMAFMAYLLGKTVYRPLNLFEKHLNLLLSEEASDSKGTYTGIEEYDHLLSKTEEMRCRIQDMLGQIIRSQEEKSRLQLEKLRYQINPHFLMNTLNTVHWMAVLNSQPEIDSIVQALNRLCFYNLDKDGINTDLERELTAIHEYVLLQKVRYDFDFKVVKVPQDASFAYPSPKFMLQPLIENALYHGYRDNMKIGITVIDEGKRIKVCITFYERWNEKAFFEIENGEEGGTCVWIDLPKIIGDTSNDG